MNSLALVVLVVAAGSLAFYFRDELAVYAVDARNFIMGLEGFSATAYADDAKSTPDRVEYSIGYGHQITGRETTNDPEALLDQDIEAAQAAIARLVASPLTPNQLAALTSFVYNVGAGAFAGSTMLRKLNAGDYAGAADEFARWIHAGGKVSTTLQARRAAERRLFLS